MPSAEARRGQELAPTGGGLHDAAVRMSRHASVLHVLREAVPVALVALLVLQGLRQWVMDRYPVTSGSMEPILHGDPERGDVVLVDKLSSPSGLRRFDLVVMENPEAGHDHVIKRVVAFGDEKQACRVELRDEDLWLGPADRDLRRVVKDPAAARDLRVQWFQWPACGETELQQRLYLGAAERTATSLRVPLLSAASDVREWLQPEARRARLAHPESKPLPAAWLGTARPVDAAGVLVADCGIAMTFRDDARIDRVLLGIDLRPDAFTFCLQVRTGRLELWRNGTTVADGALPVQHAADGLRRVEYGALDRRLFCIVDGRADAVFCMPMQPEWAVDDQMPTARPLPRNQLYCGATTAGAETNARWEILALQVFHDIYYERARVPEPIGSQPIWPRFVEPGHLFLLGDNAANSHDSRQYGAVPLSKYVGRPLLVIGPWPRWQVLTR
jgi:hypothetical protein